MTGPAVTLLALVLIAASPRLANAVILPSGTLTTYPVVAKLSPDFTTTVHWKGIQAGCFAPQEDFDVAHKFSFDTHPAGKKSKVKPGTATINDGLGGLIFFGATATLGAPKGAKQSGQTTKWDF